MKTQAGTLSDLRIQRLLQPNSLFILESLQAYDVALREKGGGKHLDSGLLPILPLCYTLHSAIHVAHNRRRPETVLQQPNSLGISFAQCCDALTPRRCSEVREARQHLHVHDYYFLHDLKPCLSFASDMRLD